MITIVRKLLMGLTVIALAMPVFATDLEQTLETLLSNNAQGYLGPLSTAFGTGVNSGTFHTAKPHKFLGFDVTLNMAATEIPTDALTYNFFLPDDMMDFTVDILGNPTTVQASLDDLYEDDRVSSTLFGSKNSNDIEVDEIKARDNIALQLAAESGMSQQDVIDQYGPDIIDAINGAGLEAIPTPAGIDLEMVPMVVPQFAIGLPFDIEFMLRGAPEVELEDVGKVSFLGYGAKIGLNQFIPFENALFPRVTAGYYLTNLTVGDILDATNSIMNLQVSKSIPFITVYGGYGIESSSMDVSYEYEDSTTRETSTIEFSLDGKNETRITAGARLKLAMLSLHADYSQGEYTSYSVGLGITLR